MKYIFLLFIQFWNKFLNFIDFNPLWSEWIFIVQIMKLLWVFQVNFKNTSSPLLIRKFSPIFQICHPLETPHRQWQTHRPTIEIVSIKILDEFWFHSDWISHPYIYCWLLHIVLKSLRLLHECLAQSSEAYPDQKEVQVEPPSFSDKHSKSTQAWCNTMFDPIHSSSCKQSDIFKDICMQSVLRYRSWYSRKVVILKCFHTFNACSKSLSVVGLGLGGPEARLKRGALWWRHHNQPTVIITFDLPKIQSPKVCSSDYGKTEIAGENAKGC